MSMEFLRSSIFNQVGLMLEQVQAQKIDILTMNEINLNLEEKTLQTKYRQAFRRRQRQCAIPPAWSPTTVLAKAYRQEEIK